jgi:hypothetical protein
VTASLRRTVTVTVAVLGVAFLLSWSATVGPQGVIGERQTTSVVDEPDENTTSEQESEDSTPSDSERPSRDRGLGGWVRDAGLFIVLGAGLLVFGLVLRGLVSVIRRRLPDEQLVIPLEPLPDLDAGRSAVERDQELQREALAGSDVRNGIVECWVIFERAAAEANVARRPAETATEFVVRFLHSLDVDPRPVGELARLFHEARFSSHPMASDARTRARRALAGVHRDLVFTGVPS